MMEFEGRKRINTNLNIAPLIDVVFLLLLFFMLTANFITHPGIKISLPLAASASVNDDEKVVVTVSGDRRLYVNEDEVGLGELALRLKPVLSNSGNKNVVIRADENVDLGLAVKVMDISRQAGAEGMVISTKSQDNVQR